jgi:hypothetical protein
MACGCGKRCFKRIIECVRAASERPLHELFAAREWAEIDRRLKKEPRLALYETRWDVGHKSKEHTGCQSIFHMSAQWDAPVEFVSGWIEVHAALEWERGTGFSSDYAGSLPLHYASLYSAQPELVRLLFAQSKAAIVEEGGNLWNNHPGQKNFTPLKLAEGYNTGPAKVAIVQVLKECEAEYQEELIRAEEAAGSAGRTV